MIYPNLQKSDFDAKTQDTNQCVNFVLFSTAVKLMIRKTYIQCVAKLKGVTPMPNELKPCPFCGGEAKFAVLSIKPNDVYAGFLYAIKCSKCGVNPFGNAREMNFYLEANGDIKITEPSLKNKKEMIDNWNTRIAHPTEKGGDKT